MGVCRACPNFWVPPIISGTGKATDFKFGQYIHKVHPNKSPLKISEKRERGHIQGLPKFFGYPIISGTGKATNFQFCRHSYRLNRKKSPLRISGKVRSGSRKKYLGGLAPHHLGGNNEQNYCVQLSSIKQLTYNLCTV